MRWGVLPVCLLMAAVAWLPVPAAQAGFHRVKVGDIIENIELSALSGGRMPLLGESAVNVFVFFKPGQPHSRTTLEQLARCEKTFTGKSVRWVAVASDRFQLGEIEAEVKAAEVSMPVLIDSGDALYGRLGVAVCPTVGVTDDRHRLVADLAFIKVNYSAIISGHIRRQLKEINPAQLEDILNPPPAVQGGDGEVARRNLKYASKLLSAGKTARALETVQASLEKDPQLAAAFVLRGRILSEQGRLGEALEAFDKALQLDPSNPAARNAKETLARRIGEARDRP